MSEDEIFEPMKYVLFSGSEIYVKDTKDEFLSILEPLKNDQIFKVVYSFPKNKKTAKMIESVHNVADELDPDNAESQNFVFIHFPNTFLSQTETSWLEDSKIQKLGQYGFWMEKKSYNADLINKQQLEQLLQTLQEPLLKILRTLEIDKLKEFWKGKYTMPEDFGEVDFFAICQIMEAELFCSSFVTTEGLFEHPICIYALLLKSIRNALAHQTGPFISPSKAFLYFRIIQISLQVLGQEAQKVDSSYITPSISFPFIQEQQKKISTIMEGYYVLTLSMENSFQHNKDMIKEYEKQCSKANITPIIFIPTFHMNQKIKVVQIMSLLEQLDKILIVANWSSDEVQHPQSSDIIQHYYLNLEDWEKIKVKTKPQNFLAKDIVDVSDIPISEQIDEPSLLSFARGGEFSWNLVDKIPENSQLIQLTISFVKFLAQTTGTQRRFTIVHDPCQGASTLVRQLLWNLKFQYKCFVSNNVTASPDIIGQLNMHTELKIILLDNASPTCLDSFQKVTNCVLLIVQRKHSKFLNSDFQVSPLEMSDITKLVDWLDDRIKEGRNNNTLEHNFPNAKDLLKKWRTLGEDVEDQDPARTYFFMGTCTFLEGFQKMRSVVEGILGLMKDAEYQNKALLLAMISYFTGGVFNLLKTELSQILSNLNVDFTINGTFQVLFQIGTDFERVWNPSIGHAIIDLLAPKSYPKIQDLFQKLASIDTRHVKYMMNYILTNRHDKFSLFVSDMPKDLVKTVFLQTIEQVPYHENFHMHLHYARFLGQTMEEYDNAIQIAKIAVDISPTDSKSSAFSVLGDMYRYKGAWEESFFSYRQSLELKSDNTFAQAGICKLWSQIQTQNIANSLEYQNLRETSSLMQIQLQYFEPSLYSEFESKGSFRSIEYSTSTLGSLLWAVTTFNQHITNEKKTNFKIWQNYLEEGFSTLKYENRGLEIIAKFSLIGALYEYFSKESSIDNIERAWKTWNLHKDLFKYFPPLYFTFVDNKLALSFKKPNQAEFKFSIQFEGIQFHSLDCILPSKYIKAPHVPLQCYLVFREILQIET